MSCYRKLLAQQNVVAVGSTESISVPFKSEGITVPLWNTYASRDIIAHQDQIKELRAELRKLESKTKREGPTKMELAVEFFKNHPGLARKEYVEKFMSELGHIQAGARTYIQIIITKNK